MFSNTCAMTLAQKSDRILAKTRGLSGATPNATQLIEELRWALEAYRQENATLTAERDEARADAERWEDDALRLLNERNAAQRERDAARREVCARASSEQALLCLPQAVPEQIAVARGWDCFKEDGK